MTAPTLRSVHLTDACRAECARIRPADTAAEWTALVAGMSDAQLAHTVDRLESLPGGEFRRIACAEFDRRAVKRRVQAKREAAKRNRDLLPTVAGDKPCRDCFTRPGEQHQLSCEQVSIEQAMTFIGGTR